MNAGNWSPTFGDRGEATSRGAIIADRESTETGMMSGPDVGSMSEIIGSDLKFERD